MSAQYYPRKLPSSLHTITLRTVPANNHQAPPGSGSLGGTPSANPTPQKTYAPPPMSAPAHKTQFFPPPASTPSGLSQAHYPPPPGHSPSPSQPQPQYPAPPGHGRSASQSQAYPPPPGGSPTPSQTQSRAQEHYPPPPGQSPSPGLSRTGTGHTPSPSQSSPHAVSTQQALPVHPAPEQQFSPPPAAPVEDEKRGFEDDESAISGGPDPGPGMVYGAGATTDDVGTFNGGSYRISHRDTNTILTIQLAIGAPLNARPGITPPPSPPLLSTFSRIVQQHDDDD